ncbi:organomercurial lyase [Actinomadura xylanilytica]|uniref:organomercurial lyase n=1 Tax=Actinomadura xylanilytica TaxID=887459 RepID=UPI00255B00B5|nr:organomercurial lyase [Actinomadura xylanilytica]MDL4770719.1 organomercurial lyase [Actinomadura xylanilytica]
MLELTVLTVPDCPSEPVLVDRLTQALDGRPDAPIIRRVVETEADAARWGMRGSPTLLINGVDVFAAPNTPTSVSCRLYRDETGSTGGAPSIAALGEALRHAAQTPIPAALAQAAGRSGLGRVAPVEGGLRAVHQRVLRAFTETGRPPAQADLDEAAAPYGTSGAEVMAQLHTADFLRLDAAGALTAAYPFSPTPTAHRVQISGGPEVFSMCAIDALGIAAMVGQDVTIRTTEPGTGTPITVTVPADGQTVVWEPADAVVFYGQQQADCGDCCSAGPSGEAAAPSVAADVCCGYINFFTSTDAAQAWVDDHPEISGRLLRQREAWEIGVHIFSPLLKPTP